MAMTMASRSPAFSMSLSVLVLFIGYGSAYDRIKLTVPDKEKIRPPEGPLEFQIPTHSFLQILFRAAMAESAARYEVLGLSGEGTL